jgi:hypothetical protein
VLTPHHFPQASLTNTGATTRQVERRAGSSRRGASALVAYEGRRVSIALADGSFIDGCELVSVGRGCAATIWVVTPAGDMFIPVIEVVGVWPATSRVPIPQPPEVSASTYEPRRSPGHGRSGEWQMSCLVQAAQHTDRGFRGQRGDAHAPGVDRTACFRTC